MNVSVNRDRLISVLKENLMQHKKAYDEAFKVWKEDAVKELQRLTEKVEKTDLPFSLVGMLVAPEEHTKDYERALRMLSFETRNEIVLEEHEARCYLDDEWSWKNSFTSNTMSYLNKAFP